MAPGIYRAVLIPLAAAGAGAAGLVGLAVAGMASADALRPALLVALAGAASLVGIGLWAAARLSRDHGRRLERLRGDLLIATAHDEALSPRAVPAAADEVDRLAGTLADCMEQQRLRRAPPDARLAAVVGAAAEGLLVVTDSGLVSLVNAAALDRLGPDRVMVGTSIYDVLHRTELAAGTAAARDARQPVNRRLATLDGVALDARIADLGDAGGIVISLPGGGGETGVGVAHDLRLHEQPPPAAPITDETPLDALPVVVLDTETTGVDVTGDRIVSIGAVRLHGGRIFRHLTFDRLVDPGQAIPARSTAVHGISTTMVAGAPAVAAVLPAVAELLSGAVVVGHCIAFDLRMLEAEAARAGLSWASPPSLCTMLLAGALFAETDQLSLDALAERLGVTVRGRHTALGDALTTAEVYARLLPLMVDKGVTTFGAARALSAQARRIGAQQRAAGW